MPFNGSGQFTRIHNWQEDRDNGIDILADRHDAEDDNIADALSLTLLRDGTAVPTQNLPMDGKRHTGAGAAVDPTDYVIKQQLDDALSPGTSNIGDYLTTERDPGANWLKRDGSIKDQADYPDLAALLGTKYASFSGFALVSYGTSGQINGLAYGGGRFVAVEASGAIRVSTNNGVSWVAKTSGTTLAITQIGYGNGNFVAVGQTGLILSSSDAEAWTIRSSGTTETLQNVVYADGRWVVVGDAGKILVSTDLVNWAARTVPGLPSGTHFYGIAYGNGRYCLVGGDSTDGIAAVSLDGASSFSWSKTGAPGNHQSVTFGAGIFVSNYTSTLYSSRSGTGTWAALKVAASIGGLGFSARNFFAVGNNFTTSSLNGTDWALRSACAQFAR